MKVELASLIFLTCFHLMAGAQSLKQGDSLARMDSPTIVRQPFRLPTGRSFPDLTRPVRTSGDSLYFHGALQNYFSTFGNPSHKISPLQNSGEVLGTVLISILGAWSHHDYHH